MAVKLIRQNTDYALRAILHLAGQYGKGAVATRKLAEAEQISYPFACKILQELHTAGLVKSVMGPTGGYKLCRPADQVTLLDVIEVAQGPVNINSCVGVESCPRKERCPISKRLAGLQDYLANYLTNITLADLLDEMVPEGRPE